MERASILFNIENNVNTSCGPINLWIKYNLISLRCMSVCVRECVSACVCMYLYILIHVYNI